MRPWASGPTLGAVLVAAVLGSSFARVERAFADVSADPAAAAQALYDAAVERMDAKEYASACPKLEEVKRLIPEGIGARITLAECYEGEDRLASAWAEYSAAKALAERALSHDPHQEGRVSKAATKIDELRPKLAELAVHVPADVATLEGLSIKLDGIEMGRAQWDEKIPIDVGDHPLEVSAPGKATVKKSVHVDHDGAELTVPVEPLVEVPRENGGADKIAPERSPQVGIGLGLAATGVVATAVGFGLGGYAMKLRGDSRSECDAALDCTQRGLDLRSRAKTFANASTGVVVVGAVLAVTGVVVAVTAPRAPKRAIKIGAGSVSFLTEL